MHCSWQIVVVVNPIKIMIERASSERAAHGPNGRNNSLLQKTLIAFLRFGGDDDDSNEHFELNWPDRQV